MAKLDWYFDFVSAYAYLQLERFDDFPEGTKIRCRPVLFAGLLGHYGHLGPAEIVEKRRFTYRQWVWLAERLGVPFKMPPSHPFNPLAALRLVTAADGDVEVVRAIFRFIWREGRNVEDAAEWRRLTESLGIEDAEARVQDPEVKAALRRETEEAIARGVFGVPTFVIDGDVLWGLDATDMVLDRLRDPGVFASGEYARVSALPIGTARKI